MESGSTRSLITKTAAQEPGGDLSQAEVLRETEAGRRPPLLV